MEEIPLHLIHAFVTFAHSKNILEAAGKLGVTQPALTKQLQQFESHLPLAPYQMKGRKKILSMYGERLYQTLAPRIGHLQDEIVRTNQAFAEPASAKIRVSGRREIIDRLVTRLKFAGQLTFIESGASEIFSDLLSGRIDMGFTQNVPDQGELIAKLLFKDRRQVVVPRSFMKSRPTLDRNCFESLIQKPFASYKDTAPDIRHLLDSLGLSKQALNIWRIQANWDNIIRLIESEQAWSVCPTSFKVNPRQSWTLEVPLKVIPESQFFVVYQKSLNEVPWFRSLLSEIKAQFV